jgi:hypothetical protein
VQSHRRLAQMRAVCLSGVLYEYMYGVLYRRAAAAGDVADRKRRMVQMQGAGEKRR